MLLDNVWLRSRMRPGCFANLLFSRLFGLETMIPEIDTDQYSIELLRLADRFAVLDRLTENAFLAIGAEINDCYLASRAIAELAEATLSHLETDGNGNALAGLQSLVERSSLWMRETEEQSLVIQETLGALALELAGLIQPVDSLSKDLKVLYALRISTRLKASQRLVQDAVVLSEELFNLSRPIQENLQQIYARAEFLDVLCRRALTHGRESQAGPLAETLRQIEQAQRDGAFAADRCTSRSGVAEALNQRSAELVTRFGELVAALQFQDITRQRLEHVRVALAELAAGLPQAPDRLAMLARVGRLQEQQLDLAIDEFCSATDHLTENLTGMAVSIGLLATETATAVQINDQGESAQLAIDIQQITTYLETVLTTHRAAGQAIFAVCQRVRDVVAMAGEGERLGEEMPLLSQNAAVSVAGCQVEGAGLEVVAANIQRLALNASQHAEVLTSRCHRIVGQTEGLDAPDHDCGGHAAGVDRMLAEGRGLVEQLTVCISGMEAQVGEISAQADGLGTRLRHALRAFNVREHFLCRIEPLQRDLKSMVLSAEAVVGPVADRAANATVAGLQNLYTMNSEREVHRRYLQQPEAECTAASSTHAFGDNVELF